MKKQTIWILTILMAITFVGLLCIQIYYVRMIVSQRHEQFEEAVKTALVSVAARLEQDETRHFLEQNATAIESSDLMGTMGVDTTPDREGIKYSVKTSKIQVDLNITGSKKDLSQLQKTESPLGAHYHSAQDAYRNRYLYQKSVLDDVVLNILAKSSSRPISERADSARVSLYLREALDTVNVRVPFEFAVANYAGTILYKTAGFSSTIGERDNMFVHALFPNDVNGPTNYLKVYFPSKKDYVFSSMTFMVPAFVFSVVLLIIFVYTIVVAFRQKKLTEMKNDFINNMTHEFKTPISSISLAAQMLNDQSVRKSPTMLLQISNVINDETKRLRFQVEKVLQMSLFDRQRATLKLDEVDANAAIFNIVNTFKLKVEKYGGSIEAHLDAMDAIVTIDEFHFTNVIFNLLDNAVKYRSEDRPLHLTVASRNISDDRLEITIRDNGIGIRREHLKKIFEKFYRVSTGNRHDVKGFGLGLAYVHKMVGELGGEISVDSEINIGTKFIIILPLSKN